MNTSNSIWSSTGNLQIGKTKFKVYGRPSKVPKLKELPKPVTTTNRPTNIHNK